MSIVWLEVVTESSTPTEHLLRRADQENSGSRMSGKRGSSLSLLAAHTGRHKQYAEILRCCTMQGLVLGAQIEHLRDVMCESRTLQRLGTQRRGPHNQ